MMDAESRKRLKHFNLDRSLLFSPVTVEILGVVSPEAKMFVIELARCAAAEPHSHTPVPCAETLSRSSAWECCSSLGAN